MAEAAVTQLLEQVKEMVVGHKEVIAGAKQEFMLICDELGLLKAIVKDVLKPKKYNNLFKELEGQIKDLVYEVENAIDRSLTKAIETNSKGIRSRIFSRGDRSLAKEVKSIREERLTPMLNDAKRKYALVALDESRIVEDHSHHTTEWAAPIRQDKIIGFDGEVATIIGYLTPTEPKKELEVITIVGIPGQGKTTLAWKVYQNEEICFHFPIRVWISISQVFEIRNVFLQILRVFTPSRNDLSGLSNIELAELVRSCFERERFLLVLDDVWTIEAWDEIKKVLPVHNGEGKVLITSRNKSVSERSAQAHELKFLDDGESWELLQYEVFGNLESCPHNLEEIGIMIARNCGGVPLMLVVIGGILCDQLSRFPSPSMAEEGWKTVLKFESDALQSDRAQRVTDVVDLSYNRLPDHLRDCFLYLGVFPQDYEIPTKTLSMLWISEGFVLPAPGVGLEESVERMIRDLINRNLLKAERINDIGEVKTCRVPNMIRAFCIAKSREENLFQEMKVSKTGRGLEPPVSEAQRSLRLCLHSGLSLFLSENPTIERVRSVLCFYDQPYELEDKYVTSIRDAFPKLRILCCNAIKFPNFPAKLTKLIHLRHLTLHIENLAILPEAITQLWNLQALVVWTRSRSVTMKANLWKMVRLRHLITNAAIALDKNWEGEAGFNLQTLSGLSPESCTEAVYKKARNLKTLVISGKLDLKFFESGFLEKLSLLEKLKLVNRVDHEGTHADMLHSLPNRNCFPSILKRLTLTNTCLGWEHMSTLAKIRSLEALKLKDKAFVGVSWKVDGSGYDFPRLQLLHMTQLDLFLWEASDNSFPNLRALRVNRCSSLKEIPECLGKNLEKLEITHVRPSVVVSAEKIAETKKELAAGKFGFQFNLKIANF